MDNTDFNDLMARLIDDTLSPNELEKLTQTLREHPERHQLLRDQLETADLIAQTEDELRDGRRFVATVLVRTSDDPFVEVVATQLNKASSKKNIERALWVVIPLLLAIIVISGIVFRGQSPVLRIAEVSGPVLWTADGVVVSETLDGRAIRGGTLDSLSVDSWAVLEYSDGTRVTISGLSRLTVANGPQKEVRLGQGRLSVNASPQSPDRPMLIHTPTARLEIVGTQLNVDSNSTATVVNVNEGLVRLIRLVDGRTTDVPAAYQAVASVDRHAELIAIRRPEPTRVWQSRFPAGVNYGDWQVGVAGSAKLRAKALLLTCAKPKPLLIYVASAAIAAQDSSPLVLADVGRFVVRGEVEKPTEVFFGVTMNHPNGGFAGKYITRRDIDGGDSFEWTIPLVDLKPLEGAFPPSPVGLEIVECWCVTAHDGGSLAIHSIELQTDH